MSVRTPRIAALACALLLLAIGTSTAPAATWGNSGGTSFTATSTSVLGISNGTITLYCPGGGGITASINAGTTAASWTAFTGATMNWGAPPAPTNNCTQGSINYTLACSADFTATAHSPATDPSPGTLGATTTGPLTLSCVFKRTATGQVNCTIAGTIAGATYTNGAPATFAFPTAATLIARDGTSPPCFLGNNVPASLSATTFTTTTASPPRLYHG